LGAENLEGLKDLLGLKTDEQLLQSRVRYYLTAAASPPLLGAENLEGLKDLLGFNT
jgi:hypothetical protein